MMTVILILLMILYLFFCGVNAVKRGTPTARLRFWTVLICSGVSFVIAMSFKDGAAGFLNGTVFPWIDKNSVKMGSAVRQIMDLSPELLVTVENTVVALLTPITYLFVFAVTRLITWLLFLLTSLIFKKLVFPKAWHRGPMGLFKKYVSELQDKVWISVVCGVLQGLVVIFSVMIPFTCYVGMAADAMDEIAETGVLTEEESTAVLERKNAWSYIVHGLDESFVFRGFRWLGTNHLYRTMTDITISDTLKISIVGETGYVSRFVADVSFLSKHTDLKAYGEREIGIIHDISDTFAASELLSKVIGEATYVITDRWMAGEAVFGFAKPSVNEIADEFIDDAIVLLNGDARIPELLKEDFDTIARVAAVLIEDGTIADFSIEGIITDGTLGRVKSIFNENPRMNKLISFNEVTANILKGGVNAVGNWFKGVMHSWFG